MARTNTLYWSSCSAEGARSLARRTAFEGNVVSLQLLDVLSGEAIVAQQLVVAPEGGLHGSVLYVATLFKYAAPLDASEPSSLVYCASEAPFSALLRPTALLGCRSSDPLGLCPFGWTFIRTQRKGATTPMPAATASTAAAIAAILRGTGSVRNHCIVLSRAHLE